MNKSMTSRRCSLVNEIVPFFLVRPPSDPGGPGEIMSSYGLRWSNIDRPKISLSDSTGPDRMIQGGYCLHRCIEIDAFFIFFLPTFPLTTSLSSPPNHSAKPVHLRSGLLFFFWFIIFKIHKTNAMTKSHQTGKSQAKEHNLARSRTCHQRNTIYRRTTIP